MTETEEEIPAHLKNETIDMSSFSSDDDLKKGKKMALEFAALTANIKDYEATVKVWKVRLNELAQREIPTFFGEVLKTDLIGVPEAGVNVRVVPYYHANIKSDWPQEQREKAFAYLEEEGYGDVVKVEVTVAFLKGELKEARELEEMIRNSKFGNTHTPVLEMGVHYGTLTSMVKEQIEAGQVLDLEVLGATVGRTAKIEKRKK